MLFSSCKQEENTQLKIGYISQYETDEDPLTYAIWNGIVLSSEENGNGYEYYKYQDSQDTISGIESLYNNGCRIIVTSEYSVGVAIKELQKTYSDCYFICIGYSISAPTDNTINITFSEHEAGFLSGIATALKINTGCAAAIFGMDVPSSSRYVNGFILGLDYANQRYNTSVSINDEDILYIGSYNDPTLAEKVSEQLYKSGVKCIFTDGGSTSTGIFNSAKRLRSQIPDTWVVGVNTDRYADGTFLDNYSVTLTSIIYKYDVLINDIIHCFNKKSLNGLMFKNYGVAENVFSLPEANPNLTIETIERINEVSLLIKNKQLNIPNNENLIN